MSFQPSLARALSVPALSLLGYQAMPVSWRSPALDDFVSSLLNTASAHLHRLTPPPAPSPPPASSGAELSALLLSQQALARTMEHVISAQTRSDARAAFGWLLPAGVLAALAGAWYRWGWEGFGWVSLEQLQQGLEGVRQCLGEKITALREEVLRRFTQLEDSLRQSRERIDHVSDGVDGLRQQTEKGNEMIGSLEHRLSNVEKHTQRSAKGVELLVHLVSASNLFADADDEALTRLREFQGLPEPPHPAPLPAPAATPRLMERSSSSFMQMLMAPPVASN